MLDVDTIRAMAEFMDKYGELQESYSAYLSYGNLVLFDDSGNTIGSMCPSISGLELIIE